MSADFISFTLQQVRISLAEATCDAGLTRNNDTVPQSAARRFRAHVKLLAIILRRLIMLMALSLTPGPIKAQDRKVPAPEEDPVVTKSQSPFSIALSGQTQLFALDGPGFPEGASRPSGPVPVAIFMRRFEALARIFRNPEKYALRMARVLERRRRAGAARPLCAPIEAFRLKPEVGAAAAGLPMLLADAFNRRDNSS